MIAVAVRLITCRRCGHRFDAGIVERGQSIKCPDCTEHFKVDGRSFAKHDRKRLPLGHIRIAQKSGTLRRREIKVRNAKGGSAWTPVARWWWEQNKGPIPLGQRVYHVDGDTLNDDPSNYALGGWADGIQMKAMDDPEWWSNHIKKMRRGTAEHNRLRGAVKRARSWNRSQWYPVDLAKRQIINTPAKKASKVYAAFGVTATPERRRSSAIGWPEVRCLEASILACLIEAEGECDTGPLRTAVDAFRVLRGWHPLGPKSSWFCAMRALRRRGFIETFRNGKRAGLARITLAAIEAQQPPCPVIIVHGSRLGDEPFRHFAKVNADGGPIGRDRGNGMELLAQAISGEATLDEISRVIDGDESEEPLLLD